MLRLNILLPGLFLALGLGHADARNPKQTREEGSTFVGAVGCRSSSCHGGAGEKRSQYITWSRQDFHTRAYPILLNARSARIGEAMGIVRREDQTGGPESDTRCTVCHSPFQTVSQERLSPAARSEQGISCESCHGAASRWLRGHTRTDWTYATRVSAGMHDLRSLYVRANTCVACHQNVGNELLKNGHPTLVFELDSQSVNQPRHWKEDDSWSGARAWLVGQAVALREAAWAARTDRDPAADMQETSVALAWLLAKVTLTDPNLPKVLEPSSSDLQALQTQADDLARRAAKWNPDTEGAMLMVRALADTDTEFSVGKDRTAQTLFYRGRRLVLGLERLVTALNDNRGGTHLPVDNELNQLRQDVLPSAYFDPPSFANHLRTFREALKK